jgi:hypothetical protein
VYGPPVSWIIFDWVPLTVNCRSWLPEEGVKLLDEISVETATPSYFPCVPISKKYLPAS